MKNENKRIVWVLPFPVGITGNVIFSKENTFGSGNWIDDTLKKLCTYQDLDVTIITTSSNKSVLEKSYNGVNFICLNFGTAKVGKLHSKKHDLYFKKILRHVNPNVVHIWGTETGFTEFVIRNVPSEIPVIVTIQGLINAISKFPNGNVSRKEMVGFNIIENLKYVYFQKVNFAYKKQRRIEAKILSQTKNVVLESDWGEAYCKTFNPNTRIFHFKLQINDVFLETSWDSQNLIEGKVFSIATRVAHKGLHNAIKAINIVAKQYPKVILVVPGKNRISDNSFLGKILISPYQQYCKRLIKNLNLENNIQFTGDLNPNQIAKELSTSNAFIMPSVMENQSASLREAMAVGTPSVSTSVGCINEYISHGENGYLYNYEEYEVLAHYLIKIISSKKKAKLLSRNSIKSSQEYYLHGSEISTLVNIYSVLMRTED